MAIDGIKVAEVGPQGPVGPRGPQGIQGRKGDKGDPGVQGPPGTQGPTGPQGPVGATGPQGPRGVQGLRGEPGEAGPAGPAGPIGPAGPQGPRGDRGPQGQQGERGNDGYNGEKGERGLPGPPGPAGPRGPVGPQGAPGIQGERGEKGLKGDQGIPGVVSWNENLTAEQREQLRGPRGERGPQGVRGERGDDGYPGARGEKGERGPAGPTGAKGDRGPIGPEGPVGPPGIQGPQGERGPMGYVSWEQGHQPPEDVLQLLKGPKGDRGDTGATGPQGLQGIQGPPGPQGIKGDRGPKGDTGGIEHGDGISESTTWNSKTITDYVNYGKIQWNYHEGPYLGVAGTESGYLKDLVVRGLTQVNFINTSEFGKDKVIQISADVEGTNKDGRTLYNAPQTIPGNDQAIQANTSYTIIFKATNMNHNIVDFDNNNDKFQVIVDDGPKTTYAAKLKEGWNKISIQTRSQNVKKINIKLYENGNLERPGKEGLVFNTEMFMILRGDQTGQVTPRYFVGKKGVGDSMKSQEGKYKIEIETRGKNLLNHNDIRDDYYVKEEQGQFRYLKGTPGESLTFIVYCKKNTEYTLTMKTKSTFPDAKDHVRCMVLGYDDDPQNGEPGHKYLQTTDIQGSFMSGGFVTRKFRTSGDNCALVLYLANLSERAGQEGSQYHVYKWTDLFDELQLEEGERSTTYEPYTSITKQIITSRQVFDGESLMWSEPDGRYIIAHSDTLPPVKVDGLADSDTTEEHFIKSFKRRTYAYIKTRTKTVFGAKFPIDMESENSYYKDEWQFVDEDSDEHLNFLKLPNGFLMAWKRVNGIGQTPVEVEFLETGKIIHAQATGFIDSSTRDGSAHTVTIKKHDSKPNTVIVLSNKDGGKDWKAQVMIIADNRTPQLP